LPGLQMKDPARPGDRWTLPSRRIRGSEPAHLWHLRRHMQRLPEVGRGGSPTRHRSEL